MTSGPMVRASCGNSVDISSPSSGEGVGNFQLPQVGSFALPMTAAAVAAASPQLAPVDSRTEAHAGLARVPAAHQEIPLAILRGLLVAGILVGCAASLAHRQGHGTGMDA